MARSKYINTFDTTAEYDAYIDSAYPEFPNVGYDKEAGKVKIMSTSPNDHIIYGTLTDPTIIPVFRFYTANYSYTDITAHVNDTINTFYLDIEDLSTITSTIVKIDGLVSSGSSNITSFKKINLDASHITKASTLFIDNPNLTYVDLSGLNFNGPNNVVTEGFAWFRNCSSLTEIDMSQCNFYTSDNYNYYQFFYGCTSLKVLNLNNCSFGTPNNQSQNVFKNCSALTDVYINVEKTLNSLTNNLTSANNDYIPSTATIHYNGTDYKWQNNAWTPQN